MNLIIVRQIRIYIVRNHKVTRPMHEQCVTETCLTSLEHIEYHAWQPSLKRFC